MRGHRRTAPRLDLEALPPDVSAVLEGAIAGDAVAVHRSGLPIGSLEFRSNVLEGSVVERPRDPEPAAPIPEGVTVVATAMRLSGAARRRMSDEFGEDYVVVDMHAAPASADVLLTHPVSTQLLGLLRHQFPRARVLVTEIEDDELGVSYAGPVSRLLDAGASAYLPPRPVAEVAAGVRAYLTRGTGPELEAGGTGPEVLPAPPAER